MKTHLLTPIVRVAPAFALLFSFLFLSSGCTSLQSIRTGGSSDFTSFIRVGDTVTCTMHLGRPLTF